MMAAGKFATLPRNMQMNHQFPLATSMDLLSSKSPRNEHVADTYQDVCIHGTLPRRKKGPAPVRCYDMFGYMGTLPLSKARRLHGSLVQDVIEEYPTLKDRRAEWHQSREQSGADPAVQYVQEQPSEFSFSRIASVPFHTALHDSILKLETLVAILVKQQCCRFWVGGCAMEWSVKCSPPKA